MKMSTYHNVRPHDGFAALVASLQEMGQPDPYSMGGIAGARIQAGGSAEGKVFSEFYRLLGFYSHLLDLAGKDIWQELRLAKAPIGSDLHAVLKGDCEDAVLTLMIWLLAKGIPRGAMTIVVCRIDEPGGESVGHAVLAVETTETTLICDLLMSRPVPWDGAIFRGKEPGIIKRYEWLSRQKAGQEDWVSCRPAPTLDKLVATVPAATLSERVAKVEERLDEFIRQVNP